LDLYNFNLRKIYLIFLIISAIFLLLLFLTPIIIENYLIPSKNIYDNFIVFDFCDWVYSFGNLICHQRADRSWFINGIQMPVCVRCLGISIGICIASVISVLIVPKGNFIRKIKKFYFIDEKGSLIKLVVIISFFMLPLIIDGFSQIIFEYSSLEITRFITGLLFGYFEGSLFLSILCSLIPIGE